MIRKLTFMEYLLRGRESAKYFVPLAHLFLTIKELRSEKLHNCPMVNNSDDVHH